LLGDRVLTKNVRGKDQKRHILGRYMQVKCRRSNNRQILFDGDIDTLKEAEAVVDDSYETLRFRAHKMKEYYSEGQIYKKSLKEQSVIVEEAFRDREYVQELAKLMKEKHSLTSM
jgi:hypothetical protein